MVVVAVEQYKFEKEGNSMKIRSIIGILAVVLAGLFMFSLDVADARTIYVDASYTGRGDGSRERPYFTIQAGIDGRTYGGADVIIIKGGTYVENIVLGLSAEFSVNLIISGEYGPRPVVLRPADPDMPVISVLGYRRASNIIMEIKNITIEGGYTGIGIFDFTGKGRIQIHECNFLDYEEAFPLATAILIWDSFRSQRSFLSIYNNAFSHSGYYTIVMYHSGGGISGLELMRLISTDWSCFPIRIFNNLFYRGQIGVHTHNSNASIYNNTFQDFDTALICSSSIEGYVGFINNIVFKPRYIGIICNTIPYPVMHIRCNDIFTSSMERFTAGVPSTSLIENINRDPLFVNLDIKDLRLRRGSPCIDGGITLDGRDRDGSPVDMGAYGGLYSLGGAS